MERTIDCATTRRAEFALWVGSLAFEVFHERRDLQVDASEPSGLIVEGLFASRLAKRYKNPRAFCKRLLRELTPWFERGLRLEVKAYYGVPETPHFYEEEF